MSAMPSAAGSDGGGKAPALSDIEKRIVERTNDYRQSQGLAALEPDPKLYQAAKSFARYMARTGNYGHEADGRKPSQRVAATGYEDCIVRENIALVSLPGVRQAKPLADRFMEGWIESKGHRENLEAPYIKEYGIAVARTAKIDERSGEPVYYAVQLFATPMSAAIAFKVRNGGRETRNYEVDGEAFDLPELTIRTHTQCTPPKLVFTRDGKRQRLTPEDGETITLAK